MMTMKDWEELLLSSGFFLSCRLIMGTAAGIAASALEGIEGFDEQDNAAHQNDGLRKRKGGFKHGEEHNKDR